MAKELRKEITTKVRKEISAQEMAKGMAKGKAQGKRENNTLIIKNMLEKNYDINEIAEITGLSIENIQKIQNQEQS